MNHNGHNSNAFDPFRIQVDTSGVAGVITPAAMIPGMSYEGTRPSRQKRDRPNQGGSGDRHIDKYTLFEFQQIALEMDRNNGLSCRMLDAAVENICGDSGFTLASGANDEKLQDKIETDWWNWLTHVCDPAGELHGIQRFANMELAKHQLGGSFIQWDKNGGDGEGQFRLIEATRVVTPVAGGSVTTTLVNGLPGTDINGYPLVNGIARDKLTKQAKWYWIADYEPLTATVLQKDGRSFSADDIIHYYSPRRESITRSLPVTAPLVRCYDNIDDVLLYETLGLKKAAAVSLAIETSSPADTAAWQQYLAQQQGQAEAGDKIESWAGDDVIYTRKGEKPSVLQSTRPSSEVQAFIVKLIRLVGLPLAIPYEWLLLDFTQGTLGNLRVLMQIIQRTWKKHQFNHGVILSKIFSRWIERQIERGRYPNRPDVRQHAWNMPTWASPQPVQDATANKIAIEGGWGSEEDAAAQGGKQIDRIQAQRERFRKANPKPAEKPPAGPKVDKNGNPDQSGGTP